MANEDETVWIVFNGEIYNYRDLAEELRAKGHVFRTKSDTEVILHLFEEEGDRFARRLRGIFSVALWDARERRLVLAVDHLGVKPLYYVDQAGRFAFASELKGLLCLPWVDRQVSRAALQAYLAYLYVPAPLTAFDGLLRLPPGHVLVRDCSGGTSARRFWQVPSPDQRVTDFDEAARGVREKLDETIRTQMVADVDVGVFLSGGIDSALVTGLMAANSPGRVKTFTVGFGGSATGFSELEEARSVARHFDTDHHEIVIEPKVVDLLPRVAWHFDEPFGNSTSVLAYEIGRAHV